MSKLEHFLITKPALIAIILICTALLTTSFVLYNYSREFDQLILLMLALLATSQLFYMVYLRRSFLKFYFFQKKQVDELRFENKSLVESEVGLIQEEKKSSIGTLVACVTHEMNTPLGFVMSSLEFLNENLDELREVIPESEHTQENIEPLFDDISESSKDAMDGVIRVSEIVKSLKEFSRVDRADLDDIDIVSCFESSLMVIKHKIPKGVKIVKTYKGAPLVNCSATQVNQVFINLLNNAIDAIGDEGTIDIKIFSDVGLVNVFVEDSGKGIDPEQIDDIFVPFYTTKSKEKGTGLGLYICKQIIDNHKGDLLVESNLGKGSIFVVRLPEA